MNKMQAYVERVKLFTGEVVNETKKTTWPAKQELTESTVVVIVSVLILAVFVGVCDKVLIALLKALIAPGRM